MPTLTYTASELYRNPALFDKPRTQEQDLLLPLSARTPLRADSELLGTVVESAITARTDEIDATLCSVSELEWLRSRGYVAGKELGPKAFLDYFERYETISCPEVIQVAVDTLRASGITWKRASGFINVNLSFSDLKVIFIRPDAEMHSWFHELAHIAFHRINGEMLQRLVQEAREAYLTVINPPNYPEGEYLLISGMRNGTHFGGYCSLDHHGDEGIDNELWANLFAMYGYNVDLVPTVADAIQDIINNLAQ